MSDLTPEPPPTVSVVVAAFADERWLDLVEAVASVRAQTRAATEIVVVVDHNDGLRERAAAELSGVRVLANTGARGASGARNTGVRSSCGDLSVFLDDDAVAEPEWLENLIPPFDDPRVVGVGGLMVPAWSTRRPRWFAPEFDWVVGASYRGMPVQLSPVRNVWSENMAVRRPAFDAVGGFREGFGKTGSRSRPEDTDLCVRVASAAPGSRWLFQPAAVAHHKVPPARERPGFFLRRCFAEGQGKAELGVLVGRQQALTTEKAYARTVLPRGVRIGLTEAAHGDPGGVARVAAIGVGAAAAAAGMAQGRLQAAITRRRRRC